MKRHIRCVAMLLSVFAAGFAHPAGAAPLHYWNFDQAAGNYPDVADGSNAAVPGPGIMRTNGVVGSGAMLLDNLNNNYATTGADGFSVTNGITVEALVRWSPAAGWSDSADVDTVVRKEEGGNRILLALQPNGAAADTLAWGLNVGSSYGELDMPLDGLNGRPTFAQATNGVHHIVATYDKATGLKAIYWDGVLLFSSNYVADSVIDTSGTNQSFTIGNLNPNNSEAFNGLLDEIAFYDYALTMGEIGAHYTNALGGNSYFYIPAPVALPATSIATTSFNANWEAVSGSTNYFLDVAMDASFAFLLGGYSNLAAGAVLTYPVTAPGAGGIYYYRVRAQSAEGFSSANSGVVTVATPYVALGPVHYWNYDQDVGNFPDIADGSNSGVPGPDAVRTNGLIGSGAVYYGNIASAYVAAGTSGFVVTNGIAVEALVRWSPPDNWSTSGDFDTIVRKEEGANRILLSFQPNGASVDTLAWGLNIGGAYGELDMPLDGSNGRPTFAQATNGLHHIVATYDVTSGLKHLYWDGTMVFQAAFATNSSVNTAGADNQFVVGNANANDGEAFNGVIDEVAFYDDALSAAQTVAHYTKVQQGKNYYVSLLDDPEFLGFTPPVAGMVTLSISNLEINATNLLTVSFGDFVVWRTSVVFVATGGVQSIDAVATNGMQFFRVETWR